MSGMNAVEPRPDSPSTDAARAEGPGPIPPPREGPGPREGGQTGGRIRTEAEIAEAELTSGTARPIPAMTRARIWIVRAFLEAWFRVFGLNGLYAFGRFFGTCEYLCDYKRRRRVNAKLTALFKEEATPAWRRRMTRRYFMRVRCDKYFYAILDRIPRQEILNRVTFIGRELLDEALAENRGIYVALCHYGSHHVAGLIMALLGYRATGVRDPKESPVRRYIQQKYRETFPEIAAMRVFGSDVFPRELFRAFEENQIVASLPDVDRNRGDNLKTLPVQIFGETREFLTGPLRIAYRCGAPIFQGFVISEPNFHYRLVLPPRLLDPTQVTNDSDAIARTLQVYAEGVERHARAHPDHLMRI